MRRRVIKDVIPRLLTYLDKQAEVSVKAGPVYTHSQAYKLQVASLKGLGRLCKQLEIGELRLDAAARVCSLYLSCRQPVDLQQVGISTNNERKFLMVVLMRVSHSTVSNLTNY